MPEARQIMLYRVYSLVAYSHTGWWYRGHIHAKPEPFL